jgi:CubicO group peptidase (beta-lactamase class C family)
MKSLIIIALSCLLPSAAASQSRSVETEVDRYLAPYIQMKDFSGTVLIAKDGEILVRKGYGMANYELGIPNSPQTKFHIASLSKTFTAAAIVLLQKLGLLSFDDPLSKFLPDFPNSDKIKISHLLTHSSGVPDFYALPEYEDLKTKPMTLSDWMALLKTKPLDFEPGKQSSYSNSGYALLAFIIVKVSSKSYEQFLRERIFAPLKMDRTGIWDDARIITNRASGYDPWIDEAGLINTPFYDKSVLVGSGSLYSTVDDLYAWYNSIHAGSFFRMDSLADPYGWGPRKRFRRDLIEQGGNDPGFVSNLSAYLKDDVCIIVLGNVRTGAIDKIKDDLGAIVFKETYELPVVRKTVAVDPKTFRDYVGQYEVSPKLILTVKTDGQHLYLKGTGGYFLPLEPLSETKYFYRQFYVPIVFDRDKEGRVNQLLWAGQYPCKKLSFIGRSSKW